MATRKIVRLTVVRDSKTGRFSNKTQPLKKGWTYIWNYRWANGPNRGKFAPTPKYLVR
jgi:hypothetical protein